MPRLSIVWFFLGMVVLGLIAGGAAVGVRAGFGDSGPSDSASSAGAGTPASSAVPGSAAATADAWAAAWSAGKIDALYALLDRSTQTAVSLDQFTTSYGNFRTETTQTKVSATVDSVRDTGEAGANLSVRLSTAYFGEWEYTIALRLSRDKNGWRVSWDPSAIHPDLTLGHVFKSSIQRPQRGSIFDRNGQPLAVTQDIRLLGLDRGAVTDRAGVTAKLGELGFTKDQVDAAFASPGGPRQRIPVGRVPDDRLEAALQMVNGLPGVLLYFESQRVHPLGAAAAHVVGYTRQLTAEELAKREGTGYKVGDRIGATGLEAGLEKELAGQIGATLRLFDLDGTVVKLVQSRDLIPGKDFTTTLDSATLKAAAAKLGSRPGAAVVIDPRTNALLALNSSPSFDPDAFERNDGNALNAILKAPNGPLNNRATGGLYSAGSTFKLVTGAAGLASGLYTTTDRLNCSSIWTGIDPPRRNWEGAQGLLTIAEGLMRSCNPVFYEIGLNLYRKTDGALSDMARTFGFGSETGIGVLSEEAGQVPDAAWKKANKNEQWYAGDEVNLAIGQGDLLITPLQLANAYSSFLAGSLRTPVAIAGTAATTRNEIPLTAAQKALLLQGLQLVTSARGTASAAFAFAGYNDFGGKSGTAEDLGTQQHVLFVAFSPAAAPRAVASVVLDDGQSGSIEAGPIARDIVLTAIR